MVLSRQGYETFTRNICMLPEGKELEIEIRSCETYQTKVVKAIVARRKEELPDGDSLWIRALVGHLLSEQPWYIKINEIVEEH